MSERSVVPLGEVIAIKHGFAFPGDGFVDDPALPTLVTPGNFALGGGFKAAKPKTFRGEIPPEYVLKPGDLMVSMTDLSKQGDTLGLPALVPADGTYLHNQRIGLVSVLDPSVVDRKFLGYYLRTDEYRAHILGSATGSTVRHTSPSRISSFRASLPCLHQQVAIAKLLGALDDKIVANRRLANTAQDLASRCYDRWSRGLPTARMSEVLTPVLGGTPARSNADYWSGANLWASANDITRAPFDVVLDTQEKISDLAVKGTRAKPLPQGSVILTARGTVGAVGRLAAPSSFNQSCYGFAPGLLGPGVLYFAVLRAKERAKAIAHGSVFDTITTRTFEHLEIPDPVQSNVHEIETRIEPLLDSVSQTIRESQRLAEVRDALLPLLMSGKLRVRDAEKRVAEVV